MVRFAALLVLAALAPGQDLRAQLERERIFEGQTTLLRVVASPAASAVLVQPPSAEGLDIRLLREGRGTVSQRVVIIQGQISREETVEYVFLFEVQGQTAGRHSIRPVEVEVEGRRLASGPLVLEVQAANSLDAALIEVDARKSRYVRGERIRLAVDVLLKHLPPGLGTSDPLAPYDRSRSLFDAGVPPPEIVLPWLPKPPAGLGEFATQDWLRAHVQSQGAGLRLKGAQDALRVAGEVADVERSSAGGEKARYRRYRFAVDLLAEAVGSFDLGVPSLSGQVVVQDGSRFVWQETFARAEPIRLTVEEPPVPGRPDSFTGAVGTFEIEMPPPAPSEVQVQDPVFLTVIVRGQGYLKGSTIDFETQLGPRFRVDAPRIEDGTAPQRGGSGPGGTIRRFDVKVRPLDPGILEIPSLRFAHFDPELGRYRVLETPPHPFVVRPGPAAGGDAVVGVARSGAPGSTLAPVALAANIDDRNHVFDRPWPAHLWLLLGAAGPLAALLVAGLVERRRRLHEDPLLLRRRRARGLARERLRAARAAAASDAGRALEEADSALRGFLADHLGRPAGSLTAAEARAALLAQAALGGTSEARGPIAILEAAESVRFGAMAPPAGQVEGWITETLDAVTRGTLRAGEVASVLLVLAASLPAQVEEAFSQAQAAFRARDFARAARLFETCLDSGENGALLFNLGNARLEAGEIGRAIAAYRRAERHRPDDANIQHNLAQALSRRAQDFSLDRRRRWYDYVWFWRPGTSFGRQAAAAGLAAWLFAACWVAAALRPAHRRALRRLAALALGAALLIAGAAAWTHLEMQRRGAGVVTTREATLRQYPAEEAPAAFDQPLREGSEFEVLDARPGWLRVRVAGRFEGWVEEGRTERF